MHGVMHGVMVVMHRAMHGVMHGAMHGVMHGWAKKRAIGGFVCGTLLPTPPLQKLQHSLTWQGIHLDPLIPQGKRKLEYARRRKPLPRAFTIYG